MKKPKKYAGSTSAKHRRSGPSARQWDNWKPMKFCSVNDPVDGERIKFRLGDDILVLNHGWTPGEPYDIQDSWVGKVRGIRGSSPRQVWLAVQWYWSGEDISEHSQTVNATCYGRFERSLSTQRQIVSLLSVNGKATVVDYDETSLEQKPIPSDVFFTRRKYDPLNCIVSPPIAATCLCSRPYNPDDTDPMHLCPRDGCRRWYHQSCLHERGSTSCGTREQHRHGLLDVLPKRLDRVPPDVLTLACVPIVRGGPTHGIAGNVRTVCEAREWAELFAATAREDTRAALRINGNTLDRWLDSLDDVEVDELVYPDEEAEAEWKAKHKDKLDEESLPAFMCPSCGKSI
ncbi:hypothetical protein BC834DRAFT_902590 [Gloeopeniophorella convolvens]|nr:hypothetical protein BC834DRAFT_902590 [Gloeopeniophorella convolvens]